MVKAAIVGRVELRETHRFETHMVGLAILDPPYINFSFHAED